jgi:hypothetical protein
MKKSIIVLFGFLFLLTFCATAQWIWVKSDFNQTQFNSDVYRCQQEAMVYASSAGRSFSTPSSQSPFLTALFGEKDVNYQIRFKQCMELGGYKLEKRQ